MAKHSTAACGAGVMLLAVLHCTPPGQAYASVCAPPSVQEFFAIDQWNLKPAGLHEDGLDRVGDVEQSYRVRPWHRRQGDHAHVMRVSHDYRAYEIETSPDQALQTNGHLHRLALSYRFTNPGWELSVAPVLAGSSNAGRHPKVIDAEFIFWQGFALYRRPWAPSVDGYWGVCLDDRFGSTRLTPVFGIDWRVNDQLDVTLGFPDTRLIWRMHPRLRLQADIHPAGGRWRVYDDALVRRSPFAMESWRLRVGLAFRINHAHELIIGGGREVQREFAFRLIDGTDLRTEAGNATFTRIGWRWRR
ncbi:MAG: DUF6268 family outer membrane beta-barrel protein [Gammaproteobacteria bacterium]|nr:DUF6268 family outer membrane beta-barrel protein [Gammaproteobacteria bacterium]